MDEGLLDLDTVDIEKVNDQAQQVSDRLEEVLGAVRWISQVNNSIQQELERADKEVQGLVDASSSLSRSLGEGDMDFRDLNNIKNEVDYERNIQDNIDSVIQELERLDEEIPKMIRALKIAREEGEEVEEKTEKFMWRYD